ncbi:MAG TPA: CHAD domain-containing protein [Pyrinomonadaceae bacterium]|nr:CHAD domain-containing protein [Pyrinomonadaceae bacterium]
MAKAKEIIGLDCAADALPAAAEVLRARFDEVVNLRGAALDFSDIEGVHRMRVAIRRLRSALRDFTPLMAKRPPKRLRKELKQLADALGAVRDHDVALVALEALRTEAETETVKEGVGRLLEERNRLRAAARLDLTEALAVSGVNDLQARFTASIGKVISRKKLKRTVSFGEAGRGVVAAGLRDLLTLGASLYEPFDIEELHEMRIAAKRLRYAVELFTACWGESVVPFAEEIAEMQGFLGEVHDCDVWIESMGSRLRGGQTNTSDYQAATWLLSEFVKKRTKEYRSALKLWSEWQSNDFAGRMRATIQIP